ncbi:MAG TPA: low temperature requirement protein A [Gaiellaceae bacterium]|nr:low temperature requirement protein A [Gaiellaceae bacterium]
MERAGVTTIQPRARISAVMRQSERVTPLELFFDLVFVLALTQCTALMAEDPTWAGLGRGLLVLAVLWWSWVGYAWLTSVVDPEEGAVRLVMFAAMAALLVTSLAVPDAFGDDGLLFAATYAVVRAGQLGLFVIASADDPKLRQSVLGLAASSAIGVGLLVAAAGADGWLQGGLWLAALLVDMGGPYFFGAEGWSLEHPSHFAERHGLIIIIALGESIVAIGVGAGDAIGPGEAAAAVLGIAVAAALWWLYFDVVALLAERGLARMPPGRDRNELARDTYSYLHFPMVAGIVLGAFGLKTTLAHVGDPLGAVPAVAMLGGSALYLLAHVGHRYRNIHTINKHRLVAALAALALIPAARELPALATLAMLTLLFWVLIVLEAIRFAGSRERARQALMREAAH